MLTTILIDAHILLKQMNRLLHAWLVFCVAGSCFAGDFVGSQTCATCHAAISNAYRTKPMARSSGRLESIRLLNGVVDQVGTRYEITGDRLRYAAGGQSGEVKIDYYIGSGAVGRSLAFQVEGFLFQSPVSWFAQEKNWRVSPGFEGYPFVQLARAIEPECLHCHASGVRHVPDTLNRYAKEPFTEGGVACERCHGPGSGHLEAIRLGKADRVIVNPRRLSGGRRDSVCAQCHLTGEERIERVGRNLTKFQAGEDLADYIAIITSGAGSMTATSHGEDLARSQCQQASQGKMWCGSCHDVHATKATPPDNYRAKCLQCHQTADCRTTRLRRAAAGDACATCHMPKRQVKNIGHTVYTDHSIPRSKTRVISSPDDRVRALAEYPASQRELAIAMARIGNRNHRPELVASAAKLLSNLQVTDVTDAELLLQTAYAFDQLGDEAGAETRYRQVLTLDASRTIAAANLGAILVKRGQYAQAASWLESALARNPGAMEIRLNLAVAWLQQGRLRDARAALVEALRFNPNRQEVVRLLKALPEQ